MGDGTFGIVEVVMGVGTGMVVAVVASFVVCERYRRSGRRLGPVEHALWVRAVGELAAEISSGAMELARREEDVNAVLREVRVDGEARRESRRLLSGASASGFWEGFAAASGEIEGDPEAAARRLRELRAPLEASLARLGEAEKLLLLERHERGTDDG